MIWDFIKNSNVAIELSLNPFTWYWLPRLNFLRHRMLPDYRCVHLFFLPVRLYFVLDSGRSAFPEGAFEDGQDIQLREPDEAVD